MWDLASLREVCADSAKKVCVSVCLEDVREMDSLARSLAQTSGESLGPSVSHFGEIQSEVVIPNRELWHARH